MHKSPLFLLFFLNFKPLHWWSEIEICQGEKTYFEPEISLNKWKWCHVETPDTFIKYISWLWMIFKKHMTGSYVM